ncbi:MAG: polyketide synthase dehydratase domain-containing protein [Methylococcaceae bacterium]
MILRIAALTRKNNAVEVVIRCNKTNYFTNHFRALCLFEEDQGDNFEPIKVRASSRMSIKPKTELYGRLFFHRGRFARVSHYNFFNAWQCSAEIEPDHASKWFSRYLPQNLVLGDPGSRDAGLHAIQACIPQNTIVPISIEKLVIIDPDSLGPWTVRAQERSHEHDTYIYDLELIGVNGKRREFWQELKLGYVTVNC